jgi:F-type H+-transporting ATPase subunit gamma
MRGVKEVKRRLRAVRSTAKITRAMQLVASSKMRFSQRAALQGRRYAQRLEELAQRLLGVEVKKKPPLLAKREIRVRGILLVATDKGLCGALNSNSFRLLPPGGDGNCKYVAVGKKGSQFLAAGKRELLAEFSINDRVPFFQVRALANFLRDRYLAGEIDSVEVLFPFYINTLHQEPTWRRLLPLDATNLAESLGWQRKVLASEAKPLPDDRRELLLEPSPLELLETLLESFFRRELYHVLLEAKAAEQSARMVAMKTATDNAEDLARELRLEYNKARQANITNEILEITPS